MNDEDFIERQASPTKFDTVSEFSEALDNMNKVQDCLTSSRCLSKSLSKDMSPNSERPTGLLKPIKITACSSEMDKSPKSPSCQPKENSDQTEDSTIRANTDFKNTQRLKDQFKKGPKISKIKKPRLKSPTKNKSKIRVSVPKEKAKSDVNKMNLSVGGELVVPRGSRTYLTTQKTHTENHVSEAIHIHDGYLRRKNLFETKLVKNSFHYSDYKDKEHMFENGPMPVL